MLVRLYFFDLLKFGYLGMLTNFLQQKHPPLLASHPTSGPHGSDGDWHCIDNARWEAQLQMPTTPDCRWYINNQVLKSALVVYLL